MPISFRDGNPRNQSMSYRHHRKLGLPHTFSQIDECIYCPLNKPIAWPIIIILFVFSPFIFSHPTLPHSPTIHIEVPSTKPPVFFNQEETPTQSSEDGTDHDHISNAAVRIDQ